MKTRTFLLISTVILCIVFVAAGLFAQSYQTPAEKTNFQAGPTMYDDMMKYINDLEVKSELLHVQNVTKTLRGRDVVLCMMSNPPVHRPADILNSTKPIVLIVNNVHGGEVAGKEASLILMRDLLFGELRPLLDEVVVLNIPTINPDGAEANRRQNEQNFDMNRDYLKLESQEIRALVTKVINKWHPDIHVDTHHGGSEPYVLTYQTIMNPAGDPELMRYANEEIIPNIHKALLAENYDGFWYSGARRENGKVIGWSPTSVEPRKQHVYSGLSNMVGFLFETPRGGFRVVDNGSRVVPVPENEVYRHQVRGEYIGLRELIRFAAENPVELRKSVINAKERATLLGMNDSDGDRIVLDYEQVSKFELEFWFREGGGRSGDPDAPWQKKKFPIFTKWSPTRTAVRPWGYVLPPQMAHVVSLLLKHEITVKKLTGPAELNVEVMYATDIDNSQFFQGHYLKKFKIVKQNKSVEFPAGSFFVPAGQPKSNLLCYLLEPETNDNVGTWSFLDMFVEAKTQEEWKEEQERRRRRGWGSENKDPGQFIPIYRLMKSTEISGTVVNPREILK